MSNANPSATIIKHLERISSQGHHQGDVFDDFLDMSMATLEALPEHLRVARKTGTLAEDTPETQALFKGIQDRYERTGWKHVLPEFSQAFFALLESTTEFRDVIGDTYMEFGHPNPRSGQFFTPFHVAEMMAQITGDDIEEQIHERIKEAAANDPVLQAMIVAGFIIQDAETAQSWFFDRILPAALPYLEPIKVQDPACGSGVMFLALASCTPRWILDFGLVQFYGQDIDQTCVKMAQLNMLLYGLNGFSIKCALAMSDVDLGSLPEIHRGAYKKARLKKESGLSVDREEVMTEIGSAQQLNLF